MQRRVVIRGGERGGQSGMKVLLLASRGPSPPISGDRARAQMWLDALRPFASVTLVAPGQSGLSEDGLVRIGVRRSAGELLRSSIRIVRERLPLHLAVPGRWNWTDAIRRAQEHGPYDVAIVVLSRLHPLVAPSLAGVRTIVDAIDSLASSLTEREREAGFPASVLWRFEARRMKGLEARLAPSVERIVTVSEESAERFGAHTVTIPMGVSILSLPETGRDFDAGFWGRLAYFANNAAVQTLVSKIWPEIRSRRPEATLLIAGADAPRWMRRLDGEDGITVVSPMADRPRLLRRIKVALLPMEFGTGQSMKTLEAAEASCAIVGTPGAFRGMAGFGHDGIVEPRIDRMASQTISLLENPVERTARGVHLRALVTKEYPLSRCLEQMRALVEDVVRS
jgi:glycosyltransferase involved in cell wall biosynthesis